MAQDGSPTGGLQVGESTQQNQKLNPGYPMLTMIDVHYFVKFEKFVKLILRQSLFGLEWSGPVIHLHH